MRRDPQATLHVALFLGLLMTLCAPAARGASASSMAKDAKMAFEQQLYRECLGVLERYENERGELPLALDLLRSRAIVRSHTPNELDEIPDSEWDRFFDLLESGPLDDQRARAVIDLVAQRWRGGSVSRVNSLIVRAKEYWEAHLDPQRVRGDYLDYLAAQLRFGGRSYAFGDEAPRIWRNLVAAGSPRPRLMKLARDVFGLSPTNSRRQIRWPLSNSVSELEEEMARFVLAGQSSDLLRARAHLVLASVAERKQDSRGSIEHLRWVRDQALDLPQSVRDAAEDRLQQWDRLEAVLQCPDRFRPGSQHPMQLKWRNAQRWSLSIEKLDAIRDLRTPTDRNGSSMPESWRDLVAFYEGAAGRQVYLEGHDDTVEARAREGDSEAQPHLERSKELWIDPLDIGLYRVRMVATGFDGKRATSSRLVRVSSLGMRWVSLGGHKDSARGQLWIVDMETGRAVASARGRAFEITSSGSRRPLRYHAHPIDFETDGTGRASIRMRAGDRQSALVAVAEHNGEAVLGIQYLAAPRITATDASRVDAFIWSDRPVYQPGERVHLQAVMREILDSSRERRVPSGSALVVELRDATGSVVDKRTVTLDDNGSVDLAFDIDPEATLGRYRWTARFRGSAFEHSFDVAEVRWPEFMVDVDLETGFRPVLGDSIRATIRGEYLFGGPVEGRVTVQVLRQPRWRFWRPLSSRRLTSSRSIVPPQPHFSRQTVASYALNLDENGEARLSFPTSVDGSSSGWVYTIAADLIDAAGRHESGNASVDLSVGALQTVAVVDRPIVAPGEVADVLLHIEDNLGQTDVVHGRWTLERRIASGWATVAHDSLITGQDGEARVRVELEREGIHRLLVEVNDGRDGTSRAATDLWCASSRVRHLEGWTDGLLMMSARSVFLGDEAGVLLLNDAPGTDVLVTTSAAQGARTQVVRMTGSARWLRFDLDQSHRPQFHVHAVRAHAYAWAESNLRVDAPEPSRRIDLNVDFDATEVRPGGRARLHVRALDDQGKGVRTLFALASIDEAVLRVAPRTGMQRLESFGDYRPARLLSSLPMVTLGGQDFAWFDLEDRNASTEERTELGVGRLGKDSLGMRRSARGRDGDMMAVEELSDQAEAPAAASVEASPTLRTDFRSTAFWGTGIHTDDQGEATVEIEFPQSLTRWNTLVVAIDPQTRVGWEETDLRTRLPVMVRLEHPRVLREGDTVSVVAIVHNQSDHDIEAVVHLDPGVLDLPSAPRTIEVAAGSQMRVEWQAEVPREEASLVLRRDERGRPLEVVPSQTTLKVEVSSSAGGDAVAHRIPLVPAGTPLRVVARALLQAPRQPGAVDHDRPVAQATLGFELPTDRIEGADLLLAHVTPSVLGGCIQALPYLAEFPYGCTEQTLSRFVPALAVRAVVDQLGYDAGRIDPQLDEKVRRGVARISKLMRPDGTWSWWEGGPTNLYMSAYALRSLAVAHGLGVGRVEPLLERGARALAERYAASESLDDQAYILYALASANRQLGRSWAWLPSGWNAEILDQLYEQRDLVSPGPRALLALAEEYRGNHDRARSLVRHLGNDLHRAEDGSVFWGDRRATWRGRSAVESTAFVLEALTVIDPESTWRDDAARWLMLNREGRQWHSTRATANAILALAAHVQQRGQTEAMRGTVVFRSGSAELGRLEIDLEAVLEGQLTLELDPSVLRDGANSLGVELLGVGPVWVSLEANTYTRQRELEASEGSLRIQREWTKLRPVRTLGGWIARAEDGIGDTELRAGDRIRVRLRLHAVHDLDFVHIVDPRPAGLEPMERLSGNLSADGLWGRRELGRRGSEFFLDHLPAGDHTLVYELVVERSGEYWTAPARMDGLYLPIRAAHSASAELRILP